MYKHGIEHGSGLEFTCKNVGFFAQVGEFFGFKSVEPYLGFFYVYGIGAVVESFPGL